jgi:hypothetical protein
MILDRALVRQRLPPVPVWHVGEANPNSNPAGDERAVRVVNVVDDGGHVWEPHSREDAVVAGEVPDPGRI